jgi:hypothetical protein
MGLCMSFFHSHRETLLYEYNYDALTAKTSSNVFSRFNPKFAGGGCRET